MTSPRRRLPTDRRSRRPADEQAEYCPACDEETPHEASVVMVDTATEEINDQHRKFAQRPARVLVCRRCEAETRSTVDR